MEPNSSKENYLDVIIQEQELINARLSLDQIKTLRNPRYLNLLKILYQKGPSTIDDLTQEYAKLGEVVEKKSKATVYRYISLLKKNNIVQETGQRILGEKIHSKILYSLIAKYIILDENWDGSYDKFVFEELIQILKLLYPKKRIKEKTLHQWDQRFQQSINSDKERMITSKNPEILEIISIWSPYTIDDILSFLGWESFLLKDPQAQDDFLNCFSDNESIENEISFLIRNKNEKQKKQKYRDIITQFPELWHGLPANDPRHQYLNKPAYIPLFHILQDRPMTIAELTEKYSKITSIQKTSKTIYRYIQILKNANLVIEVGYRVTQGKRTTQKLYGPFSRNINYITSYDPDWQTDQRLWMLDSLIKMLEFLHPNLQKINRKNFHEFRSFVSHNWPLYLINELKLPKNRKIFELLHSYCWKDFHAILSKINDYNLFMNIPDLNERLRKCFSG